MTETDQNTGEVARLAPAPARLWGAIITIVALGLFLLWLAAAGRVGSLPGTFLFVALAALCFFGAHRLHVLRGAALILRRDGLFDQAGMCLCKISDIARVDRSAFAFKPSNGFVIRLNAAQPRAWVPGLWWRMGKTIGVGGVTSVGEAKAMADILALMTTHGLEALEGDQSPFAR